MRSASPLSPWVRLPIHGRRPYRDSPIQLVPRRSAPRHILRSRPLPLRSVNGGSIRYLRRLYPLIPLIHRPNTPPSLDEVPLLNYVPRCELNLLPSTLPRPCRNATTILRLPRRIYHLKRPLISRLNHLARLGSHFPGHSLRSLHSSTTHPPPRFPPNISRVTPRTAARPPHLRRTSYSLPTHHL